MKHFTLSMTAAALLILPLLRSAAAARAATPRPVSPKSTPTAR
jgi:hypothetical protein